MSRWSIIAAQLPGRTDNDIENYWNTRLKKKLFGKQRKLGAQKQDPNNKEENQTLVMPGKHRHILAWASSSSATFSRPSWADGSDKETTIQARWNTLEDH